MFGRHRDLERALAHAQQARLDDRRAYEQALADRDAEIAALAAETEAEMDRRDAEAASALAAVCAELAEARGETVRAGIADLARRLNDAETDADRWRRCTERAEAERDDLRVELERAGAAWRARGEQVMAAEARESAAELRADALEVTVESLTDALARAHELLKRAVPKVAAKTTRTRYTAELAALVGEERPDSP